MEIHKKELAEKGYTIFRNLLSEEEVNEYKNEFNKWLNKIPNLRELHCKIDFNGIFKHHEVGNQRFAWLLRTNEKIVNIFKELWQTDELLHHLMVVIIIQKNIKDLKILDIMINHQEKREYIVISLL